MTLPSGAAAAVDDALEDLFDRFGEVPVVESEWTVDRVVYERTVERFEAGTVGGAGVWVTRKCETDGGDDAESTHEVLLVRHEGEAGWSEPAGKQEPGESLRTTAVRETREETGVDCRISGLLRVERAAHVVREVGEDAPPALPRLVVVFEGGVSGREGDAEGRRDSRRRVVDGPPGDAEVPGRRRPADRVVAMREQKGAQTRPFR